MVVQLLLALYLPLAVAVVAEIIAETETLADLEAAVDTVLAAGFRTGDLMAEGCTTLGCQAMGERLLAALEA